jgi:hypothetical protein
VLQLDRRDECRETRDVGQDQNAMFSFHARETPLSLVRETAQSGF